MITYKKATNVLICKVYLEGRLIGQITSSPELGYKYTPKGSRYSGEYFDTLAGCKKSLEYD